MACIENMPPAHIDSEREEGEIVDELDDLSDISSEEEYLLLQRLQVLENYNHVLERKEAKRSSIEPSNLNIREAYPQISELAEAPSNLNDCGISSKVHNKIKDSKTNHHKHRSKEVVLQEPSFAKYKDKRRKSCRQKKKIEPKIILESSEESDYEYRNKRRKLANAVLVSKTKTDTSLKARLIQMLCTTQNHLESTEAKSVVNVNSQTNFEFPKHSEDTTDVLEQLKCNLNSEPEKPEIEKLSTVENFELINLSSDDGSIQIVPNHENIQSSVHKNLECNLTIDNKKQCKNVEASDEDLELLRQYALKSKASKNQEIKQQTSHEPVILVSEDEDSDTAELRLICLRSALLKKAIEMKQKQKLRRKMTQSTTLYDDVISNELGLLENKTEDNNTDTESVDMDIVSDDPGHDDKDNTIYENSKDCVDSKDQQIADLNKTSMVKEDDIEDDEDLLRAKLLTSLSKNLPQLVDPNSKEKINRTSVPIAVNKNTDLAVKTVVEDKIPEEKRFIIHTGGSDSDDEPEATKNLTKMHLKLSEQPDFQQKLDLFLKSARKEVEDTKLPDVVQQPPNVPVPKNQKFIPKPLNHLPKNEQIEYRNLVKRMAELEKLKKARLSMTFWDNEFKNVPVLKETLKPRIVTKDTNTPLTQSYLDDEIALSRKKIAEESSKVLQLREEHSNLIQKYKIVETELRNLSTAISLNKRQQKSAQNQLSKTRMKHQILLKRSTTTLNYKNLSTPQLNSLNRPHIKVNTLSKMQKENEPLKTLFYQSDLKSVKVSVVNDFKETAKHRISDETSIQIEAVNKKKSVKIPKEVTYLSQEKEDFKLENQRVSGLEDSKYYAHNDTSQAENTFSIADDADDYQSPLQALTSAGWKEDPNGVLCPFDVGGSCKDANCKYLHPKESSH